MSSASPYRPCESPEHAPEQPQNQDHDDINVAASAVSASREDVVSSAPDPGTNTDTLADGHQPSKDRNHKGKSRRGKRGNKKGHRNKPHIFTNASSANKGNHDSLDLFDVQEDSTYAFTKGKGGKTGQERGKRRKGQKRKGFTYNDDPAHEDENRTRLFSPAARVGPPRRDALNGGTRTIQDERDRQQHDPTQHGVHDEDVEVDVVAERLADLSVSSSTFRPPHETSSTRPETTVVAARRMILGSLGIGLRADHRAEERTFWARKGSHQPGKGPTARTDVHLDSFSNNAKDGGSTWTLSNARDETGDSGKSKKGGLRSSAKDSFRSKKADQHQGNGKHDWSSTPANYMGSHMEKGKGKQADHQGKAIRYGMDQGKSDYTPNSSK
ncbi:unnamed protein product [Amoebophrya sp. A25]|nr:unnamed protein product [Amoebophrya sp. A25]|eukprot:GSA25T00021942001.1